jgi:hypothetical protein
MTMNHRYQLQPYKTPSSRYTCPQCGAARRFKRYIDMQTNQPLAPHVGHCDRTEKCGYHYTPRQYFAANPTLRQSPVIRPIKPEWLRQHSTIPYALVQQTLCRYDEKAFVVYLYDLFEEDPDARQRIVADYKIGTSSHWPNSTIFWQIDINGQVRTGKIMLYHVEDCKRVKYPYNHIAWVHKVMQNSKLKSQKSEIEHPKSEFILRQCFFGEHLLNKYPDKIVALVESEKTAIIAAGKMPEYVWLAAGSLQGLNADKCKVLAGRNVMLFPDLDGWDKWQTKATELSAKMPTTNFKVSNYLRQHSLAQFSYPGMDLADLFIDDWERTKFLYREWGLRY